MFHGVSVAEIPCLLGNAFKYMTTFLSSTLNMHHEKWEYGKPWIPDWQPFFMVHMDLSTSGMCSAGAVMYRIAGSILCLTFSNSLLP